MRPTSCYALLGCLVQTLPCVSSFREDAITRRSEGFSWQHLHIMAKADGDDDWWYPSRQVPKPQNPECDSAVDLLKSMVDADRHFEIVLGAVLFIAVLGALGSSCFLIGGKVKPRPPGYWTSRSWNPFHDDFRAEVDVTMELRDTVQQLFDMTTRKEAMGIGRDGSWATHKSFRVLQVTRVENGKLWTDYVRFRRNISRTQATMRRMEKEGAPCRAELKRTQEALQAIDSVHEHRNGAASVKDFIKSLYLDTERNERLMFHGSPGVGARHPATGQVLFPTQETSPVYAIKSAGFDDRLGSVKGMYGSGTYFADMASKADQYAGQYNQPGYGSIGERATIFLSRVTLGCPYKTNQSLEQLRRPPCVQGHFDLNLFWNDEVHIGRPWREKGVPLCICSHERFDSVMGDFGIDGQMKQYREFVVYEKQCYPEFCVIYERMP